MKIGTKFIRRTSKLEFVVFKVTSDPSNPYIHMKNDRGHIEVLKKSTVEQFFDEVQVRNSLKIVQFDGETT